VYEYKPLQIITMYNLAYAGSGMTLTTLVSITALVLVTVDITGEWHSSNEAIPDVRTASINVDYFFGYTPNTGSVWRLLSDVRQNVFGDDINTGGLVTIRNADGTIEFMKDGVNIGTWGNDIGLGVRPTGTTSGSTGAISLVGGGLHPNNSITIRSPDNVTHDIVLVLPDHDGDNTDLLTTSGDGTLQFLAPSVVTNTIYTAGNETNIVSHDTTTEFKVDNKTVGIWSKLDGLSLTSTGKALSLFELKSNGVHSTKVSVDDITADTTIVLPPDHGTPDSVFTTNGVGATRWAHARETQVWEPVFEGPDGIPIATQNITYNEREPCVATRIKRTNGSEVQFSCWIINLSPMTMAATIMAITAPTGVMRPSNSTIENVGEINTGYQDIGTWRCFDCTATAGGYTGNAHGGPLVAAKTASGLYNFVMYWQLPVFGQALVLRQQFSFFQAKRHFQFSGSYLSDD
jgi:hypothetical protein